MGFFEQHAKPRERPVREERQPEWIGPPENVLPASVPLEVLLARTDQLALAVLGSRVYGNGLTFETILMLRPGAVPSRELRALIRGSPFHHHRFVDDSDEEGLPKEFLRLGVQFADGRKATNLGHPAFDEPRPGQPVLMTRGGGGSSSYWTNEFWLWPLPPPGALTFVAEWPLMSVPETREAIATQPLLEAAGRAVELWPDAGPAGAQTRSSTHQIQARLQRDAD